MIKSPITNSVHTKHIVTYDPSIMSDSHITPKPVDNYICLDTGLIFNASGPRGAEKGFYTDVYDLHSESDESEFKYFEEKESVGIYDDIANFIFQSIPQSQNTSILDVGCGKGILLSKLEKNFANSSLFGVEPSKNAKNFFQNVMPHIKIHEGVFEESPYVNNKFDLITANGVLEHVPHPVDFLKVIRSSISDSGYVYIGVPNFENNPADLFTYDHLSRFTPQTANLVFQLAGFEIVDSKISNQRVPMWFILKPVHPLSMDQVEMDIEGANRIAVKSTKEISFFFESYELAAREAQNKGKKVALFGSGAFGLIGTQHTSLKKHLIHCIFDDNSSLWGSSRLGIPILSPDDIKDNKDICGIVISANPCYLSLIKNRIDGFIQGSDIKMFLPSSLP